MCMFLSHANHPPLNPRNWAGQIYRFAQPPQRNSSVLSKLLQCSCGAKVWTCLLRILWRKSNLKVDTLPALQKLELVAPLLQLFEGSVQGNLFSENGTVYPLRWQKTFFCGKAMNNRIKYDAPSWATRARWETRKVSDWSGIDFHLHAKRLGFPCLLSTSEVGWRCSQEATKQNAAPLMLNTNAAK